MSECKNPKKHQVCEKKVVFGILVHVLVKTINIQEVLLAIQ